MRVTYVKVHKYKRFPLSHNNVFEHHFQKKLTMFVGPNGSGKSSLLGLLTPLPPDKDDFNPGGYLQLKIEHQGIIYTIISDFTASPKYFFYKGEENLNLSHNVSTQRELAFQVFSLVPVVQELMTGQESFTEMSLINRKKLIHAITHLNIESILDNYNDLKKKLSNQEFLLKNTTSLLLVEKQKLADTTRVTALESQRAQLRELVEYLLEMRTHLHSYRHQNNVELVQQLLSERQEVHHRIHKNAYIYLTAYPRSSLPKLRDISIAAVSSCRAQLDTLYGQIEQLEQQIDTVKVVQLQDKDAIVLQHRQLSQECAQLLQDIQYLNPFEFTDAIMADVLVLEHSLPDIIHQLPANPDKSLSRQRYQQLLSERADLIVKMTEWLQREINLKQSLVELQGHLSQVCPNCQHTWLPQEVEVKIAQTQKDITAATEHKAVLQLQVQQLNEEITRQETYLEIFGQFFNIFNATKGKLDKFWKAVLDSDAVYQEPNEVSRYLKRLVNEVQWCQRFVQIRGTLQDLDHKVQMLEQVGQRSIQELINQRQALESSVYGLRQNVLQHERLLSTYETAKVYHEALDTSYKTLEQARSNVFLTHTHHTVSAVITEIDAALSLVRVQLIEIDKELNNQHSVEQLVKTYEQQLIQIEQEIKVLTILTDELSPKNGFIAKAISGFLNVIIGSINVEIAKVWDYKMELKLINVQEDILNYRFKVCVEDKLTIDDISKVSSGMKEIINLGMKKTLFKLLKLQGYPLSLDEYGVRLDQTHRSRIADTIFKMIHDDLYSQIFLITHLDLDYADHKDAEVIELDH